MKKSITTLFLLSFLLSYEQKTADDITNKIRQENSNLIVPDSASFFINGYMHLEGKIGNNAASIELNIFPSEMPFSAYLFSNSLQGLFGLQGKYSNGFLHLYYDDYKCVGSIHHFYEIYLGIQKDSSFIGYVVTDSNQSAVKCSFKETYSTTKLLFKNLNFNFKKEVNKFDTELYGNLLFADTQTIAAKKLNQYLLSWNDKLGYNFKEEVDKINFNDLQYLKTRKTYKAYCISKFKRICNNIISKQFLNDAKESGHSDIYVNGFDVEVLVNDGKYIVLQQISHYADGFGYPYYETNILQYDVEQAKVIKMDDNFRIKGKNEEEVSDNVSKIIEKLKQKNLYDSTEESLNDDWFLYNNEIAFLTKTGYVFTKSGGNHGIHQFYKLYPKEIIKPYLQKPL